MNRPPRANTDRTSLFRHFLLAASIVALSIPLASRAAAAEGEVILQLRTDADIAPLLVKHQLSLIARFGARPIYRLKSLGKTKLDDTLRALGKEPDVQAAEANVDHAGITPFSKNMPWAIGEASASAGPWALDAIRLDEAHRITRGKGIRIALLDSGVDASHPALVGRLLRGFDFVDGDEQPAEEGDPSGPVYGHGTHVAGILAQMAPEARIMPLRILDAHGMSNTWVLAEAMLWAMDPDGDPSTDDGAHVINLSLGTPTKTDLFKTVAKIVNCKLPNGNSSGDEDDGEGEEIGVSVADKARCQGFGGAVVVAAAGNNGDDKVKEYPAAESSKGLVSVGASTQGDALASFSNYGWVKLAAPGDGVNSATPGGSYAAWSGTSMASPIVAGTAALVRAANRTMAVEDVVKRLQSSGAKLCNTPLKQIDAAVAVAGSSPRAKPSCK